MEHDKNIRRKLPELIYPLNESIERRTALHIARRVYMTVRHGVKCEPIYYMCKEVYSENINASK